MMQNENEDKLEKRLNEFIKEPKTQEEKKRSQADMLVELVDEENCTLFHDQFNEPYAHVFINGHHETWKLKSSQFKRWLCLKLLASANKVPNTNAISAALTILQGKACFNGPKISLENRVALFEDAIWVDLSNAQWQAVKITAQGWEVINNPPILFRRYSHQQPQTLPSKGNGDVKALLPFVNLAKSEQGKLLLVYLVSCFIPDIPHPIPILYGPQGAAKTTLGRMLRALIDPSIIGVLSMPANPNDLIQQISHNWFAFLDNITFMPDWASDALCRAVTGEGFSKRELYSDDDDVIYNFRRCIGLNGINLAAKKPDLLDRGILFKLERIANDQRKGERAIWQDFEKARPIILGGIFDALSKAIKLYPDIQLKEVPRMADFTIWGCAIAEALGYSKEEFLQIYSANIGDQHDEAIHENPVATAIMALMENKERWEGSPSKLHEELNTVAFNENLDTRGSGWPKSASMLSRRINEVKTNLAEKNILIESEKVGNGRRLIAIKKITKNDTARAINAEEICRIVGGEIIEEKSTLPHVVPPNNFLSENQNGTSGDSGGISSLPFTS